MPVQLLCESAAAVGFNLIEYGSYLCLPVLGSNMNKMVTPVMQPSVVIGKWRNTVQALDDGNDLVD